MERFLFPSNPFYVLLPMTMVVTALTPSIDPVTLAIANAPFWIGYMLLYIRYRRRQQRNEQHAATTESGKYLE